MEITRKPSSVFWELALWSTIAILLALWSTSLTKQYPRNTTVVQSDGTANTHYSQSTTSLASHYITSFGRKQAG